jgi:hypothetical protein
MFLLSATVQVSVAVNKDWRLKVKMKDKKMSIRISSDDLDTIHKKSAQAKMSLTKYVTKCCLGKQIFVIDGLNDIIKEQKAIGRNLNQLTTLANMGKVEIINLNNFVDEYAKLNKKLSDLLERKRWET